MAQVSVLDGLQSISINGDDISNGLQSISINDVNNSSPVLPFVSSASIEGEAPSDRFGASHADSTGTRVIFLGGRYIKVYRKDNLSYVLEQRIGGDTGNIVLRTAISPDGSILAFHEQAAPGDTNAKINIYTRTGVVWSLLQTLTYDTIGVSASESLLMTISMSMSNTVLSFVVYNASQVTLVIMEKISDAYVSKFTQTFATSLLCSVSVNPKNNIVCFGNGELETAYLYSNTWTLLDTITEAVVVPNNYFGGLVEFSPNGKHLSIGYADEYAGSDHKHYMYYSNTDFVSYDTQILTPITSGKLELVIGLDDNNMFLKTGTSVFHYVFNGSWILMERWASLMEDINGGAYRDGTLFIAQTTYNSSRGIVNIYKPTVRTFIVNNAVDGSSNYVVPENTIYLGIDAGSDGSLTLPHAPYDGQRIQIRFNGDVTNLDIQVHNTIYNSTSSVIRLLFSSYSQYNSIEAIYVSPASNWVLVNAQL